VGDGMFVVAGTLAPEATDCELQLHFASDSSKPIRTRRIGTSFREDFTVSPYGDDYRASVVCGGRVLKSTTVRYGRDIQPGETVSLGHVAL
jgi:hypothetical protein